MTETPGHNSVARNQTIVNACIELDRIDAEKAELREQEKDIMKRVVKEDLGFSPRDFRLVRKLIQRDRAQRDLLLDVATEMFAALSVGQSVDWLEALAKVDQVPQTVHASAMMDGAGGHGL